MLIKRKQKCYDKAVKHINKLFGYMCFVCDLNFQGWCSTLGPKSNTHCSSYIVDDLTAGHTDKLENGCQFNFNSKL